MMFRINVTTDITADEINLKYGRDTMYNFILEHLSKMDSFLEQ